MKNQMFSDEKGWSGSIRKNKILKAQNSEGK